LRLSGDEQAAMGLYCGDHVASRQQPIRQCGAPAFGATRIDIPPPGTENDDTNPARVTPRHLVDVGGGLDAIAAGPLRLAVRVSVTNLFDTVALYNFLSTFSGTHFVAPRAWRLELTTRF
jgi:hypothetical protein